MSTRFSRAQRCIPIKGSGLDKRRALRTLARGTQDSVVVRVDRDKVTGVVLEGTANYREAMDLLIKRYLGHWVARMKIKHGTVVPLDIDVMYEPDFDRYRFTGRVHPYAGHPHFPTRRTP